VVQPLEVDELDVSAPRRDGKESILERRREQQQLGGRLTGTTSSRPATPCPPPASPSVARRRGRAARADDPVRDLRIHVTPFFFRQESVSVYDAAEAPASMVVNPTADSCS
jgi:hypothetical protein